jgi:hypothetical protein
MDEVVRYFGDSSTVRIDDAALIQDEYNDGRIAYEADTDTVRWWWLRTPGRDKRTMYVYDDGSIAVIGTHSYDGRGGLRPAVWIKWT